MVKRIEEINVTVPVIVQNVGGDLVLRGREGGERGLLGRRRRGDEEVLGELLDLAREAGRLHQPAQAPAGHAEVLREAVDDDCAGVVGRNAARRAVGTVVGEPQVDLVDDAPSVAVGDSRAEASQLVVGQGGTRRIRRRGDHDAARPVRPCAGDGLGVELESRLRGRLDQPDPAAEAFCEPAVAGVRRVGDEDLVAGVDERCARQ